MLINVFARKLLQFINVLIGAAIVAAAGAVYWYGWRPLPQESGTMNAPTAKPVRVERDGLGVPHIVAQTADDLYFAQGFVTAQDRFWQMESFRRLAAGELAEVAGPAALESDREFRRLRISRIAEQRAKSVGGEDLAVLSAYARGVNYYLETHADRLPVEFAMLGFRPRMWRIEDTMLVGLMMQQTLSNTYKQDLAREAMYEKGDAAKVQQLFPDRTGSEHQPGSNAWAVAGAHTRSGKALLANDMHLGWSLPGVWYMAHLRAPGVNVTGVSVPGVPAIVAGRNEHIAWGITNLGFDVQDLYQPTSNQAVLERDRIAVKGTNGEPFEQFVNAHGAMFNGPGGKPVALRWVAAENAPFRVGLMKLNRARNWTEFREALREFPGAASNIAYADKEGNVGLQVTGPLPIRKDCNGQRVSTAGHCEWQGFIPFEELPSFYNPAHGRIVTANQNPFPANYAYTVSGNFAPHYRANRILDELKKKGKWTAEETLQLQADVYSPFSHFLAGQLTAAWDKKKATNPALRDAIALLREWNGEMQAEAAAPVIATYAANHLRRVIATRASGTAAVEWEPFVYYAVIENLLRTRPAGWFADWDHELLRALQEGVEEGARRQGDDVRKWKWGEYNKLVVASPVLRNLPWVASYFQIGPAGMSGSSTTVKQTSARVGPSMRMVVDFGDAQGGVLNLPIGQSGHPLSRHFKDQWENYSNAKSYPLHFPAGWTVQSTLELTPGRP
ncbi:MAG: penicillin acylase family protein [Bryobacterales bacterium]|nr:penicillin acylase family protein [Bryobacterales bacterium]